MNLILDHIKEILKNELNIVIDDNSIDLINEGYIDSIGVLTLLHGLEKKFNIEITFEDLNSPKIRSLTGLESFIARKLRDS